MTLWCHSSLPWSASSGDCFYGSCPYVGCDVTHNKIYIWESNLFEQFTFLVLKSVSMEIKCFHFYKIHFESSSLHKYQDSEIMTEHFLDERK